MTHYLKTILLILFGTSTISAQVVLDALESPVYTATKSVSEEQLWRDSSCPKGMIGEWQTLRGEGTATATSIISLKDAQEKANATAIALAFADLDSKSKSLNYSNSTCKAIPSLGNHINATFYNQEEYVVSLIYNGIEHQGKIDDNTHKIHIRIPYTAESNSDYSRISIQERTNELAAENRQSMPITLTIPSGTLHTGDGYIAAEITTPTLYKIKKLAPEASQDIATFRVRVNDQDIQIRLIAFGGIKDKHFDKDNDHKFIYVPTHIRIGSYDRVWLSQNLGSDYANINKAAFSPARVGGRSSFDYHGYGSLWQWGREADGHELMEWSESDYGLPKYSNITWFTEGSTSYFSTYREPCPNGYHTPTGWELQEIHKAVTKHEDFSANPQMVQSPLNLTRTGRRLERNGNAVREDGVWGLYWSSTPDPSSNKAANMTVGIKSYVGYQRAKNNGYAIRCIKDQ